MAIEKTDVVIVGMGAVGGILAAELGKSGMKVIGLERGPRLTTADFNPHDELRYFQRQDLRPNWKHQPVTWRPNASATAHPMTVLNYGNQAGGGTVHYGTLSWRMHEDDFRARSHTIERYGASAIPEDSSLADWPLSYADLEPFYDQAEYELGVSGKAGNLQGKKDRWRQRVRSPAQTRLPASAVAGRSIGRPLRRGSPQAGLSPVLFAARDYFPAVSRPRELHLLRLLPVVRLPRRREVEHPRHQAARGGCHRQFQIAHRHDVLPREYGQQRARDRRLVLRP